MQWEQPETGSVARWADTIGRIFSVDWYDGWIVYTRGLLFT